MEIIKILAVDPALRNTGLAVITYNAEMSVHDPAAFKISHCQVLKNPAKYTGTDALLNMIDMISEESKKDCYSEVDNIIIESPVVMFNKQFSAAPVIACAHITGAAIALLGVDKAFVFRPHEWNKLRKKDITHAKTLAFHGAYDTWHFEKPTGHDKYAEHVIDAVSLGSWWIKENYTQDME